MSEIGWGRSNNRRGRGWGSNRGAGSRSWKSQTATTTQTGKSLFNYVYLTGTAKQASEFSNITEYLINYIRRAFDNSDDIADILKNRVETTRIISTAEDASVRASEDENNLVVYTAKVEAYIALQEKITETRLMPCYGTDAAN